MEDASNAECGYCRDSEIERKGAGSRFCFTLNDATGRLVGKTVAYAAENAQIPTIHGEFALYFLGRNTPAGS